MKKEKGITLVALAVYVLVFSITLLLLARLSQYIYSNLSEIGSEKLSSEEFNKFNVYFVKDLKESTDANIETDLSKNVKIKLSNGSIYNYVSSDQAIYKDQVKIAKQILTFTAQKTNVTNTKKEISIKIATGKNLTNPDFEKNIDYILKYW